MNSATLIQEDHRTQLGSIAGSFTAQVFGWMTLGLMITTVIAFFIDYLINNTYTLNNVVVTALPLVFVVEVIVVIVLSAFWRKLGGILSLGLFFFYAALNGVLIGLIISAYSVESIIFSFGVSAIVFLLLAGYGAITKSDLTRWGNIAMFGLVGLVFATIINIIISVFNSNLSNGIYWITTYIGVGIFCILIAYDAQKIRALALEAQQNQDGLLKYSIRGALVFYLDFINIFIRILAITGRRRR